MTITITDMFAGAGGEAAGIAELPDVQIVTAANHNQLAMDVHQLNHPDTDHAVVDLHLEDPRFFPRTDVAWFSPECTKWSQANSNDLPDIEADLFMDADTMHEANQSRLLMFDVLRYVAHHRYRAFVVENVVDIATQKKYALAWQTWKRDLAALGYEFVVVSLNSMHAQFAGDPAPQSRDRLYVVAWPKGERAPDLTRVMRPKAWCEKCAAVVASRQAFKPRRTVGKYRQQYVYVCPTVGCGEQVEPGYLPAAAAIDFSIPGERIGDRLSAKTRKRIAAGIARYWRPLAVPVEGRDGKEARPLSDPMRTMTTRAETALAYPPLVAPFRGGGSRALSVNEPAATFTAGGNHHGLVTPQPSLLAPYYGNSDHAKPTTDPMGTLTTVDRHALVQRHNDGGAEMLTPVTEYLRTLTTKGHQSVITPGDQAIAEAMVAECLFRMLRPHEVAAGMAFPRTYLWQPYEGKVVANRDLVRMAGNAVTPPAARDLMCAVIESIEPGYMNRNGYTLAA